MSKLEIIQEVLSDSYKPQNQKVLVEDNITSKRQKFKAEYSIIKHREIEYQLYRYDQAAFPFFKNTSDLKKMCDYILFAEDKNYLFIFIIELKLTNDSAQKQLAAASEFALFIINSAKRIGREIENFKIKKIRICDNKTKKRNLKMDKVFEFDKNDYCDYQLPKLYLAPLMQY